LVAGRCCPFDGIVVTAALGEPPPPLIEQLKWSGSSCRWGGPLIHHQALTVVEKIAPDNTNAQLALVRFVPLPVTKLSAVTVQFFRTIGGKRTSCEAPTLPVVTGPAIGPPPEKQPHWDRPVLA